MHFRIVGSHAPGVRAQRILELADRYQEVVVEGYIEDLDAAYGLAELQLVGSAVATGVRTRIVESLARGVPVLSTPEGASGLEGLRHGVDLLLANTAEEYASELSALVESRTRLATLAEAGLEFVRLNHSRERVATVLQRSLREVFGEPADEPQSAGT